MPKILSNSRYAALFQAAFVGETHTCGYTLAQASDSASTVAGAKRPFRQSSALTRIKPTTRFLSATLLAKSSTFASMGACEYDEGFTL